MKYDTFSHVFLYGRNVPIDCLHGFPLRFQKVLEMF